MTSCRVHEVRSNRHFHYFNKDWSYQQKPKCPKVRPRPNDKIFELRQYRQDYHFQRNQGIRDHSSGITFSSTEKLIQVKLAEDDGFFLLIKQMKQLFFYSISVPLVKIPSFISFRCQKFLLAFRFSANKAERERARAQEIEKKKDRLLLFSSLRIRTMMYRHGKQLLSCLWQSKLFPSC